MTEWDEICTCEQGEPCDCGEDDVCSDCEGSGEILYHSQECGALKPVPAGPEPDPEPEYDKEIGAPSEEPPEEWEPVGAWDASAYSAEPPF